MNDEISISPPVKTINETELFIKYKSSYASAFIDLSVHAFLMCSSFYSLWYFRNSWLSVFTVPLLGEMIGRTFTIFHDCGHNSYTPSKMINYIIGTITGIIVLHPFYWGTRHYTHHLTSGNKKNSFNFQYNELIFHSLRQYKEFSFVKRIIYRWLRKPQIFLLLVIFKIIVLERVSFIKTYKKKLYITTPLHIIVLHQIINNCGLFVIMYCVTQLQILHLYIYGVMWFVIKLAIFFNAQHTFNPPFVVDSKEWSQRNSGLLGSSFIQVPLLYKYFSMGIEYHHIHHMNAKIPGYNLQKYHEEVVSKSNMFDNVVKLSMMDCYNNLWLVLYDEDKKRYITFAEADEEIRKDKCI
jgi:omega-6 fatty acid desaturase (delta-12 desaturase)